MSKRRITLKPRAGFVLKTTNEEPGVYTAPSQSSTSSPSAASSPATKNASQLLDVPAVPSIPLPKGFKIFINIAYSDDVPPPPRAEEVGVKDMEIELRKAMMGDPSSRYLVSVIVSEGREVLDKAGKASLVFDAIFSEKLRERVAKDSEFKNFIMELALEKVEEGSGLVLGRDIATPNLKSKGPLDERTALLPASWLSASSSSPVAASLIQEITTPTVSSSPPQSAPQTPTSQVGSATPVIPPSLPSTPKWTLEIESTGTGPRARTARIEVQIPLMTKPDYSQATLDLEPNRLILDCPPSYSRLDVPIFAPSTKEKANPGRSSSTTSAGAPKKVLSLDIDDAKAEWRVKNGSLVITSTIHSV